MPAFLTFPLIALPETLSEIQDQFKKKEREKKSRQTRRTEWGSAHLRTLLSSISGSRSGNPISHLHCSPEPNTHGLPINFLIGFKGRARKVGEAERGVHPGLGPTHKPVRRMNTGSRLHAHKDSCWFHLNAFHFSEQSHLFHFTRSRNAHKRAATLLGLLTLTREVDNFIALERLWSAARVGGWRVGGGVVVAVGWPIKLRCFREAAAEGNSLSRWLVFWEQTAPMRSEMCRGGSAGRQLASCM